MLLDHKINITQTDSVALCFWSEGCLTLEQQTCTKSDWEKNAARR